MVEMELRFREVNQSDCRLLFEWANDPVVRQSSFSDKPIEYDDHAKWFEQKLKEEAVKMILFHDGDVPAGLARFENGAGGVEIHFTVAPEYRGRGIGTEIIKKGVEYCEGKWPGARLVAHVKDSNEASIKIFERCGFENVGYVEFKGGKCLKFVAGING